MNPKVTTGTIDRFGDFSVKGYQRFLGDRQPITYQVSVGMNALADGMSEENALLIAQALHYYKLNHPTLKI